MDCGHRFLHTIDVVPTVYQLCGITAPTELNGVQQKPIEGISFAFTLEDAKAESLRKTQYFELACNRGLYHDGWMASSPSFVPWNPNRSGFDLDKAPWELYKIDEVLDDRTLRIPDYSGNSMFNTLGNLRVNARAGIIVPDFERGRTLQLTGTAETLWNQDDPEDRTGGTHRFLAFRITHWLELPLPPGVKTEFLDYSPYNPPGLAALEKIDDRVTTRPSLPHTGIATS